MTASASAAATRWVFALACRRVFAAWTASNARAEFCPDRADTLLDVELRLHITVTHHSGGDLPQKERLKRMPSQCGPMIGAIWVALVGVTVIMATP
jgi:hypothetical protein